MKKFISILTVAILSQLLTLPVLAADGFNAGLVIDRDDPDVIAVSVVDSSVLHSKKPTLTIPCDFTNAHVVFDGNILDSDLDEDEPLISFKVAQGGTYEIINGEASQAISLEDVDITLSKTVYDYTGKAIIANPKLSYNGTLLIKDKDYTVSYTDNTEPGEATVTITGIDNYKDSVDLFYRIRRFESISGDKRYDTACDIARRAFPNGASEIILVTGAKFPDALSANAYAGAKQAPVLLSKLTALPDAVKSLLNEKAWSGKIEKVTFIGGGFDRKVIDDLISCGIPRNKIDIDRLQGATRYQTAEKVCEAGIKEGLFTTDTVIIATGASAADALSVSPWSYTLKWPILLAKRGHLNESTQKLADQFKHVILVGGPDVVNDDCAGSRDEEFVERLAGSNRYKTSIDIAKWFISHHYGSYDYVGFADGTDAHFPDALAGGMLQGKHRAPIILTKPGQNTVLQFVSDNLGGTAYINNIFFLGAVGKGNGPCYEQIVSAVKAND